MASNGHFCLRQVSSRRKTCPLRQGTRLYANAAANAQLLRQKCNLRVGVHLDTQFACEKMLPPTKSPTNDAEHAYLHHRTRLLALLHALLRLASILRYNSDARKAVLCVLVDRLFLLGRHHTLENGLSQCSSKAHVVAQMRVGQLKPNGTRARKLPAGVREGVMGACRLRRLAKLGLGGFDWGIGGCMAI